MACSSHALSSGCGNAGGSFEHNQELNSTRREDIKEESEEEQMNLQQLRVFLKVAELEHITHASEDLGFSQPAVTKMVQSLEQEIGLELIRRRKKGVALT